MSRPRFRVWETQRGYSVWLQERGNLVSRYDNVYWPVVVSLLLRWLGVEGYSLVQDDPGENQVEE